MVEIDLVNGKTDRVIGDRYEKLALDKVMRNRKERQYVGKDDSMTYMTDITKTIDIFSGHYEIQIILFLITIIVVAMHTTYHFGTILESNSYLQNMVTTFIFINLCNTVTITHGDAKLHINYFDLIMNFPQVIITMIILFFKYVYRLGTVLIQEILENYMRN